MGIRPASMKAITRGYTSAHRLIVHFPDETSAFVKASTDDLTANWLRVEHGVYEQLHAEFMPRMLGWFDNGTDAIIVLEDLSRGLWPHSWTNEMITSVLSTLDKVKNSNPLPVGLPSLDTMRSDFASWRLVQKDPKPFLSLKLCSESWLNAALPKLIEGDEKAHLEGTQLVHLDIRSDNICFIDDNRVVFVDWNWSCVGNADIDVLFWLPSVAMEGGPLPDQIANAEPHLVALITGFWAYRAGQPPPSKNSDVRKIQLKQLEVALPWCARILGLPTLYPAP